MSECVGNLIGALLPISRTRSKNLPGKPITGHEQAEEALRESERNTLVRRGFKDSASAAMEAEKEQEIERAEIKSSVTPGFASWTRSGKSVGEKKTEPCLDDGRSEQTGSQNAG